MCVSNDGDLVSDVEIAKPSKLVCIIHKHDTVDGKANSLLISKAPELLDFVNRISGEMLRNDFVLNEKWYEQAQQLIKQATEL